MEKLGGFYKSRDELGLTALMVCCKYASENVLNHLLCEAGM